MDILGSFKRLLSDKLPQSEALQALTKNVATPQADTPPTLGKYFYETGGKSSELELKKTFFPEVELTKFGSQYTFEQIKSCSVFCLWGFSRITENHSSRIGELKMPREMVQDIESYFLHEDWTNTGTLLDNTGVAEGTPPPVLKEERIDAFLKQFHGMLSFQKKGRNEEFYYGGKDEAFLRETSAGKLFSNKIHNQEISGCLATGAVQMVAQWLTYVPDRFPIPAEQHTKEKLRIIHAAKDYGNTTRTITMAGQVYGYWKLVESSETEDRRYKLHMRSAASIFLHGAHYALCGDWYGARLPDAGEQVEEIWGKIKDNSPKILNDKYQVHGSCLKEDQKSKDLLSIMEYNNEGFWSGLRSERRILSAAGQVAVAGDVQTSLQDVQLATQACLELMAASDPTTPVLTKEQSQVVQAAAEEYVRTINATLNTKKLSA